MSPRLVQLLRILFIALDILAINLVFVLANLWFKDHIDLNSQVNYYRLWVFFNIAWLALAWSHSIYQGHNISVFEVFSRKTMRVFVVFAASIFVYLYINKEIEISRIFTVSVVSSCGIGIFLNRMIYLGLVQWLGSKDYLIRKIMIIGYNDTSKMLVNFLENDTSTNQIIGYCEDECNVNELSHYPIISTMDNVMEVSKENRVTEIYSTIAPEQNHSIYQLMKEADQACIRFKIVPDLNFYIRQPVHIDYLGSMPLLSIRKEPLDDVANRIKKRMIDLIIASLVIVLVLSWLVPLIALLILIESRGPIFFVQKRSGKDNQPFNCYKFRSMYVNKEANDKQAVREDARVTKIGKFLRKTNLDEFPQFINVFLSEMSIVGPRPHMLKHTDDYSKLIGEYMVRQFLKPGITGWSQVNGLRGETRTVQDMRNRVENDIWYMENWSFWLDFKIMFLTAYNMFRGEKNAF